MDPVEDLTAEVDEPPDDQDRLSQMQNNFGKADPRMFNRRESLLTRQLHSETEHTDEEDMSRAPPRALSTQSTWSNPSVASTAELTSDDGHSVASPAISPPLPPTHVRSIAPITEKPLAKEPQIMGQEEKVADTGSEQSVEAGLGRKRCISFACGSKKKEAPTSQPLAPTPTQPAQLEPQSSASPPKRKSMLKFVCPTRAGPEVNTGEKAATPKRAVSPPPPARRSAKAETVKAHRGSDSTVTHASPKSFRKTPAASGSTPTPTTGYTETSTQRRMSDDSDKSTAATRFHEFASSEDEPEEWTQESTCHRSRLTVNDTLQKENIIRKACEEVEEEAVEEEDEEADMDDEEGDDDEDDEDEDEDPDLEAEEESDDGFRTDDEEGFAESDSEGEESDEDWWRPGGLSTAATSIEHLDRFALTKQEGNVPSSSLGSVSSAHSGHHSPRSVPKKAHRKHHRKSAVPIHNRPQAVDLPDSTDFVCGTLDEDRPLEQAYLNHLKQKEAAKHKARPQDIDPTFPTSDPEDEEDDEDLVDSDSEPENFIHGDLEELDGGDSTARRRASPRPRAKSNTHRSPPPPPARHRSPAPGQLKRQSTARSPPPPVRRGTARSPPPRKLFGGHSPHRARSPAPVKMMTSPPNTRRASPTAGNAFEATADMLASRPQLTHTASLPRGGFMLGKLSALHIGQIEEDEVETSTGDIPKRGAIDIFKGLEKKRQRRKEKLYQKACAKAAAKGEKAYKVKPGKGAERMREVGLELQRYHGKGILSM